MGRVTRAAARAEPVLADEIQAATDAALADSNRSAPKAAAQDRPALGEVTVNATCLLEKAELFRSDDNNDELQNSSSNENEVVFLDVSLGKPTKSKAVDPLEIPTKREKTTSSKRALKDQFGKAIQDFSTATLKNRKRSKAVAPPKVLEDDNAYECSHVLDQAGPQTLDEQALNSGSQFSSHTRRTVSPTRPSDSSDERGRLIIVEGSRPEYDAPFQAENSVMYHVASIIPSEATGTVCQDVVPLVPMQDSEKSTVREIKVGAVQKLQSLFEPLALQPLLSLPTPPKLSTTSPNGSMADNENGATHLSFAVGQPHKTELGSDPDNGTTAPGMDSVKRSKPVPSKRLLSAARQNGPAPTKSMKSTKSGAGRSLVTKPASPSKSVVANGTKPRFVIAALNTPPPMSQSLQSL